MPVPDPGNFLRWKLNEEEELRAKFLTPELLAKLQTMNVELAEALAEFTFEAGPNGDFLNRPDFWLLRGRRSLVLQLLADYDDFVGASQSPVSPSPSQEPVENSASFQPSF